MLICARSAPKIYRFARKFPKKFVIERNLGSWAGEKPNPGDSPGCGATSSGGMRAGAAPPTLRNDFGFSLFVELFKKDVEKCDFFEWGTLF